MRPFADQVAGGEQDLEQQGSPSRAAATTVALLIALGDAFTFLVFSLACSLGENNGDEDGLVCELWPLPVLGVPIVFFAAARAAAQRRIRPLAIGAAIGGALAALPWILAGDPAGNFRGVLT